MSKPVFRYVADFNRGLEDIYYAMRVYSMLFGVVIIIFGFFGIRPLVQLIYSKSKLINQIDSYNIVMESNLVKMRQTQDILVASESYIPFLNYYLPTDLNVQNYMLDFIEAANSVNYDVNRFGQKESGQQGDAAELNIHLSGTKYPIELVSEIEKLKRITSVSRMSYSGSYERQDLSTDVNISLIIYKYTQ